MTDALRRIEGKHYPDADSNAVCMGHEAYDRVEPDYPCDVVKLARALDEIRRECMCREHRALAERTLEEVASCNKN